MSHQPPQQVNLSFGPQNMSRQVADHCVNCGIRFVIGPLWVDYIGQLKTRGLLRTLGFDYEFYNLLFANSPHWGPEGEVTLGNCDSVFLGDLIDPEMKCPKCGEQAFHE
jgi:hypothetical protein